MRPFIVVFGMHRGGKRVADVTTFRSGKCVVAWTAGKGGACIVVYDSEEEARQVHVEHMGGRGERTRFVFDWSSSEAVNRGATEAYQDRCEGCLRKLPIMPDDVPDYISDEDKEGWTVGYELMHKGL